MSKVLLSPDFHSEMVQFICPGCERYMGCYHLGRLEDSCPDSIKEKFEQPRNGSKPKERPSKKEYYLGIALAVSKRSTCLRRHYGCIIVKNDEIIATGYNGSPRGELNCCDIHNGKCPRVNEPHNSGNYSDCPAVHAEQNAMLSASRKDMIGATMYLAGEEVYADTEMEIKDAVPCPVCERMIANAGIVKVISKEKEIEYGTIE